MKCPNLVKRDKHHCVTIDDSYIPSIFQLREYCKGRLHTICPFFLGFQRRQARISPVCRTAAGIEGMV